MEDGWLGVASWLSFFLAATRSSLTGAPANPARLSASEQKGSKQALLVSESTHPIDRKNRQQENLNRLTAKLDSTYWSIPNLESQVYVHG